jgi:hypothetical protein
MSDNNAIVGSIICYRGTFEPEGWIFCDGIPRKNENGKYNNLLEIEIGVVDGDMYTPPNHDNCIITQIDDSYEKTLELLLDTLKSRRMGAKCHTYMKNGVFSREYNNNFIESESNCCKNECQNINIIHRPLRWIIKT